jgi:hypothetical protein
MLNKSSMESAAEILETSVEMLIEFAHDQGLTWVDENSIVVFEIVSEGHIRFNFYKNFSEHLKVKD